MVSVTKHNTPALRFDGFDGEWGAAELQQIADIVGGGTPSTSVTSFWDGDIDWYSPNEVGETAIAKPSNRRITRAGLANSSARLLPAHRTVLFTSRASIGHTAILDHPATTNQGFQSFVLKNGVDTHFVFALTPKITEIAEQLATGSTFLEVSNKTVREIEVHVPATEEQRAIGELFADLDALIEQHRAKHANLQQTKTALMQRMFPQDGADEPELRLNGFSEAWEAKSLKDLGSSYGGLTGKTKEDFGHGDARYITYLDVFEHALINDASQLGAIETDNRQNEVKTGDVLFTVSSEVPEEVGMSAVWLDQGQNIYLNSFCFGFRPTTGLDSKFLAYVLRSPDFRKKMTLLAQGISRFNISKTRAMELEISFPALEEQRAIGKVFADLDALIAAERHYITQLTQAKTALLQRMFV